MAEAANSLTAILVAVDPGSMDFYTAQNLKLAEKLQSISNEMKAMVAAKRSKLKLIEYHHEFTYLLYSLGLSFYYWLIGTIFILINQKIIKPRTDKKLATTGPK